MSYCRKDMVLVLEFLSSLPPTFVKASFGRPLALLPLTGILSNQAIYTSNMPIILQSALVSNLYFISQIVECRRVLKWTYAYGYYFLMHEDGKRQLFEYLQGEAESGLERLHACAEKELQAYFDAENPSGDSQEFIIFRNKLAGLTKESEYAAWTLVNGYAVNHVTISVHRLKSHIRSIKTLNQFIEDQGYKLNSEGGTMKVSPDGLLLQSSTMADSTLFNFANGITESIPCSYIEFAERLILPQYEKLANEEVLEANERKVGKVHFKPINNGSPDVETKDLNRFLSIKVVKRKKQREMESGSNGVQIAKRVEEDRYLDDRSYHDRLEGYSTVEKGDGYDSNSQP